MQPADLLVRLVEPSDKVAATAIMGDHREIRST
jgi:predicted RNA-binding protein